jgi:hypothetical protein
MNKQQHLNAINDAGFPHVAFKINLHWDEPTIKNVFDELLFDTRIGRQGFPDSVMSALLALYNMRDIERVDTWDKTFLR